MKKPRTPKAKTFGVESHKAVKGKPAPTKAKQELPPDFNVREAKMEYFMNPFDAPSFKRRVY